MEKKIKKKKKQSFISENLIQFCVCLDSDSILTSVTFVHDLKKIVFKASKHKKLGSDSHTYPYKPIFS